MTELQRRKFTSAQAEAIEAYRKATKGNDFIALLRSVNRLGNVHLYEVDATEAIAMGYDVYGGDGDV